MLGKDLSPSPSPKREGSQSYGTPCRMWFPLPS
jgi:hypothetical protein